MRRWTALIIVAALMTALVPVVGEAAAGSPSSPPAADPVAIVSYAIPTVFGDTTTNLTITASTPVTWTCVLCPDSTLYAVSPTLQAGLHIDPPDDAGSLAFSVEAASGSSEFWQNWTSYVSPSPTIASTPAFLVAVGQSYTYLPTLVNPGSDAKWSFSGAPYFSFDSANGELYTTSGVSAGTYENVLTYTSESGNWTQAWYTTTGSLPSSIAFTAKTGLLTLNATLPTTAVGQIGNDTVWSGLYPLLNFTGPYFSTLEPQTYGFVWNGAETYSVIQYVGDYTSGDVMFYGTPTVSFDLTMNNATNVVSTPSSGFAQWYNWSVPTAPTGLAVAYAGPTNLTLTWDPPLSGAELTNETLYYGPSCYRWTGSRTVILPPDYQVVRPLYDITGLVPSTTYCLGLTAWNDSGQSGFDTTTGRTTDVPKALGFNAIASGETVYLFWNQTVPIVYTGQTLFEGSTCSALPVSYSIGGVPTNYSITGIPGGTYCFALQLDIGSYESDLVYANATVSSVGEPSQVNGVYVTSTGPTTIGIAWQAASTNATAYQVEYGYSCGSYVEILPVGNVLSYVIGGLIMGTTYCFAVQATNGTHVGPTSSSVSASTMTTNATVGPGGCTGGCQLPPVTLQTFTVDDLAVALVAATALGFVLFLWYERRRRR